MRWLSGKNCHLLTPIKGRRYKKLI